MTKLAWRRRNDGAFVAVRNGLNMTVFQPANRPLSHEMVQFVVTGWHKAVPNAIVGSGLAEDMTQGKWLAEAMAKRFGRDPSESRSQVMVVNNDTEMRHALVEVLQDDGYEVVEATSAEGALRRLERLRPPLVLVTDCDLGAGLTGLELAAEVCDLWPVVGIILIGGPEESPPAAGAVPITVVPRPISTDSLLDNVATMFARVLPASIGE